ncbi:MAG: hypothetical protein K2J64_09145 [Desulfovibrio sp.]|nr:hypothetical protein [Desulfovibrio sp.]
MKTRPIIFNTDMVQAILRGQKIMTRRPVKPPYEVHRRGSMVTLTHPDRYGGRFAPYPCPLGRLGDRLWVRETFFKYWPKPGCTKPAALYRADGITLCDRDSEGMKQRWSPSIHMPRALSRITLEITCIAVENVQDIVDDEAILEGFPPYDAPREHFRKTWGAIYAKRGLGWDANPWVWVVTFRRLDS